MTEEDVFCFICNKLEAGSPGWSIVMAANWYIKKRKAGDTQAVSNTGSVDRAFPGWIKEDDPTRSSQDITG